MTSRRNLLNAGLALPLLPFGLAACSRHSIDNNRYLAGNFGPVDVEATVTDLPVTGSIPEELVGRFLRNGPNPSADQVSASYHWFTGRGMVHGLRLDARDLSHPPLATVHLPVRVPYGFHGSWVPDSVTAPG